MNSAFTDEHAFRAWAADEITWGQERFGLVFPLVEGNAEDVPLPADH